MYIPKKFEQTDIDILHRLIIANPLATVITFSSSGLNANHIPLHLSKQPSPYGALRAHVTRANPIWQDLVNDVEVLAVFHGADAYISPSWYPTKAKDGKAVPTWNYEVVHAYGQLRVIDDVTWLRAQLEEITQQNEMSFPHPWQISDAPNDYIEKMIAAIVGIEIKITRLIGKSKISQNQPAINQSGVVQGLKTINSTGALAMAELIEKNKSGQN